MSFDWQTTITVALVVAAAIYVARTAWRSVVQRQAAACGGCGTCPASKRGEPVSVIGVDQLAQTAGAPASKPLNGETVAHRATDQ
jgi:hypothetical protein